MKVTIYEHTADLPPLSDDNYFHSRELMELCESTPRQRPFMVVVTDEDGREVMAHMLAIERHRRSWMPPYYYTHVRVLGEGCYKNGRDQQLFGLMVHALTTKLQNRSLFFEVSHLSQKMFGYRQLRMAG